MNRDDADTFGRLFAMLNLAYPRQPLTSETQTLYFERLRRFTVPQVKAAINRAIDYGGDFPPSVANLISMIEGSDTERAVSMWSRLHLAARAGYGTMRGLDFGDPVAHAAVVAMGGWARMYELNHRDSESVDRAVARREFIDLYMVFLHRGVPEGTPGALCCDQSRVGVMPSMRIGEFGLPDASAYPTLPASTDLPVVDVPNEPPEEFRKMVREISEKRALPPPKEPEAKVEYTPAEIDEQLRQKAVKTAEARAWAEEQARRAQEGPQA